MKSKQSITPIRKAIKSDKDDILSVIGSHKKKWDKPIAKKYFDEYFKYPDLFKKDNVFVLLENKTIVGVIGYSQDRYETNNYWLGWFYIHKEYCEKGSGKQLLSFVKEELKKITPKVKKLFVDTSSNEFYQGALFLYVKSGFKIEATIKNYYEENEDQIILSIDL